MSEARILALATAIGFCAGFISGALSHLLGADPAMGVAFTALVLAAYIIVKGEGT